MRLDLTSTQGGSEVAGSFHYLAYGSRIRSALRLPGLRAVDAGDADADILVEVGRCAVPELGPGDWRRLDPHSATLVKTGLGVIEIAGGSRITVDPVAGAEQQLAHYVLGPAMGLLLQQRGLFCLHASAVQVGDSAVAFAGDSGAGKSTLASAMLADGYPLVADDITAIDDSGTVPLALPGHAAFRLSDADLRRIGRDPEEFEPLRDDAGKRVYPVEPAACTRQPTPLDRVFVVVPDDHQAVEELTGLQASLALLRYCFFPELLSGVHGPAALMQRCVGIAARTRVFRLHRRDDHGALAELAALLA